MKILSSIINWMPNKVTDYFFLEVPRMFITAQNSGSSRNFCSGTIIPAGSVIFADRNQPRNHRTYQRTRRRYTGTPGFEEEEHRKVSYTSSYIHLSHHLLHRDKGSSSQKARNKQITALRSAQQAAHHCATILRLHRQPLHRYGRH